MILIDADAFYKIICGTQVRLGYRVKTTFINKGK